MEHLISRRFTPWQNFVYSGRSDITDLLTLRQLFFINTFSVLGFLSAGTFGILHIMEGRYSSGVPEVIAGGVFLLNIFLLRISKNISLAKAIMLTTQGVALIIQLATGGIAHTGIYWYFTFPISAFFLMGKQKGIVWVCFLYIATLVVLNLSFFEKVTIVYDFIEIRQLLISLFVVCLLVYLYQSAIDTTQEALEKEKVRDEALLASIGEGVIAVGTNGVILLANQAAVELLGLQKEHIVGNPFTHVFFIHDSKGNRLLEEMRPLNKALVTKEQVVGEYILQRIDNKKLQVAIVASPIILDGKVIGAVQLIRDISLQKELDKAKSEFVALASHQLRTPISGIAWITEMLLHGDVGNVTSEQKQQLLQIYQSNQRMATLVDALLNVSQLEMGSFVMKPEMVDIAKLSHIILTEEMAKQLGNKKLTINESYTPEASQVFVDPSAMKIILQNLFVNALRYTPDNGSVSVALMPSSQATFEGAFARKDGIVLRVTDTGYGIPQHQQTKIFTKLFRADNVKEKDTDGTGLGLYIVKSILDEMGGKIWFKSEEGEGTTFLVWFPTTDKNNIIAKGR